MNIKFLFLFLTEVNAYQIPKINKFNNINLKKIPDYHNVHYYDKNITLVPYDLSLIDFKLITNFEKKYIKKYHQKIYKILFPRLNNFYRDYFVKNLINKI